MQLPRNKVVAILMWGAVEGERARRDAGFAPLTPYVRSFRRRAFRTHCAPHGWDSVVKSTTKDCGQGRTRMQDKRSSFGTALEGKETELALNVLRGFRSQKSLSSYQISELNVENPSMIYFYILNNFKIIIDQYKIDETMNVLVLVLSQANLDLTKVKYLDLRFKEPVIGQK